jgi:hypothetical protein
LLYGTRNQRRGPRGDPLLAAATLRERWDGNEYSDRKHDNTFH